MIRRRSVPPSNEQHPAKKADDSVPSTFAIGKIEPRNITDEVQQSYLDYAMSVIVARALPDVRDGLKPVHRRVLYAMWDMGLRAGARYRKSAAVVGEVIAKYHPHGDIAVYDTLVRLAQDFSLRYPLVDGQGNFGSLDGDSAAAMRYTEAKLMRIAEEMLSDIDRNTVDFLPNYDESHMEPRVLPAKLPNLLLNGTDGIAVGMATKIPPHNLGELCDAIVHLINAPDTSIADLMQFVKGPDFPTGGEIYDIKEITQVYATGKGSIVMRAKAEIEEKKDGSFRIVVNEIPFQVNKAFLIEKIAELVHEKKIDGIKDLRDESDKDGVRIVIDLKKESYPKKVLNRLYSLTQMQDSFHVNMLALVDGIQPRVLSLKMILQEFIKHRQTVVRRRTEYDLEKAKARAHILRGLKIALDNLDAVIKLIKASRDREEAKMNLIKRFKLSELQANAILDMRLSQLANLERQKVEDELKEKLALIKELETVLSSPKKILSIIKTELTHLKEKFGDERRTKIFPNPVGKFTQEDLIPNESTIVVLTRDGYIKRLSPSVFKTQSRGGKGVLGLTVKEEDLVEHFFSTMTHTNLLFFTSRGRVFQLKAYEVPSALSRTAKGQAVVNFLQLTQNERVTTVLPLEDLESETKYLVMVTSGGTGKKVELMAFGNVRRSGIIAIRLKGNEMLDWVKPSTGRDDILLVTSRGQSIRISEKQLRPMGRSAAGVRVMRLKTGDTLAGMDVIVGGTTKENEQLLVVTSKGFGKRTPIKFYRKQGRGGSGIKTARVTPKTGNVIAAFIVNAKLEQEDLVCISDKGQVIRLPLKSVSVLGRDTQGVRIMRFKEEKDELASVTFV
ncbi:MAG: DNA gyrase subunit A [bacterium]